MENESSLTSLEKDQIVAQVVDVISWWTEDPVEQNDIVMRVTEVLIMQEHWPPFKISEDNAILKKSLSENLSESQNSP